MFDGPLWTSRSVLLAAAGILIHCGDSRATPCASTANGQVRRCPNLSSLAIVPSQATVGSSVAVTASVSNGVDGGLPGIAWSAPTGTFGDPSAPLTIFTCTAPGLVTVTIAATQDGCAETLVGSVHCVAGAEAGSDSAVDAASAEAASGGD